MRAHRINTGSNKLRFSCFRRTTRPVFPLPHRFSHLACLAALCVFAAFSTNAVIIATNAPVADDNAGGLVGEDGNLGDRCPSRRTRAHPDFLQATPFDGTTSTSG